MKDQMSSKSMRTVPEYRSHTGPPGFAEKPVCTETPLCEGCPFPSHGFLCQGGDGECMRTRLMKLSEKENHNGLFHVLQKISVPHMPSQVGFRIIVISEANSRN